MKGDDHVQVCLQNHQAIIEQLYAKTNHNNNNKYNVTQSKY